MCRQRFSQFCITAEVDLTEIQNVVEHVIDQLPQPICGGQRFIRRQRGTVCLLYTSSDDPSQFLTLWTTTQQQTPAVDDPEYDKMMDAATYIVDYNEYMEALHNIEHYLVQDQVCLLYTSRCV